MSSTKNIVIFGATSAIAQSVAREYAKNSSSFLLIGRNTEKLEAVKQDLIVCGADKVFTEFSNLNDVEAHQVLIETAIEQLGSIDIALIAHGTLGDQKECEKSSEETEIELTTNFVSPVSILTHLANYFEEQKKGTIAVISSVAGDRGRQSNYIYGAAKGGLSVFLEGLRNRLFKSNVNVLTIKPGFVNTPMTASLKQGPLFVEPELVAQQITKAIDKRWGTLYTPYRWFPIMTIIKSIPDCIFKRLSL